MFRSRNASGSGKIVDADKYIQSGCSEKAVKNCVRYIGRHNLDMVDVERLLDSCYRAIDIDSLIDRYTPACASKYNPVKSRDAIYGAIFGDIAGSKFEGCQLSSDILIKKMAANFPHGHNLTDDSILTFATIDAIGQIRAGYGSSIKLRSRLKISDITRNNTLSGDAVHVFANKYAEWARTYPDAGYGWHFSDWVRNSNGEPYGSYGNGSAMRISPIGATGKPIKETIKYAVASAACTHDHIEGIRGACVEAVCIWLACAGASKEEIFKYMVNAYSGPGIKYFSLFSSTEIAELRSGEKNIGQGTCMFSVPAAIIAVHESSSFNEAILNAMSVGWDTDTNACIAGAVGAPLFGLTKGQIDVVEDKCDAKQLSILNLF